MNKEKVIELMKTKDSYKSGYENFPSDLSLKAKKLCYEYNNTSPVENDKRHAILKELLGTCSDMTCIEPSFHCDYGFNIHFHGFALLNYNCVILDTSPVHIGTGTFIAPNVTIACSGHAIDPEQRKNGIGSSASITIKDNVWIGANTVICGGVTIGEGAVIGAGSVVNKDIPDHVVAAGVPCKVIREISDDDIISEKDILF